MSLKTIGPVRGRIDVQALSTARTMVAEDTGTTFVLAAAGKAVIIPAADLKNRGVWYRFVCGADVTGAVWSFTSAGTSDMHVHISSGAGDDVDVITTGTKVDLVQFVHTVALEGDMVEMYSTGVFWMVTGHTVVVEGVTTS